MKSPWSSDGIAIADTVIINKIDAVDSDAVDTLRARISAMRADVTMLSVSGLTGGNIDSVIERALSMSSVPSRPTIPTPDTHNPPAGPDAVVCARQCQIDANGSVSRMSHTLAALIERLAQSLGQSDCTMIGHIKAIARAPRAGCVMASTTDFDGPVHTKGALIHTEVPLTVTLNAIVYGIASADLDRIVTQELEQLTSEPLAAEDRHRRA